MPVKYRMVSVVRLHPQSSAAALEPLAVGLDAVGARAASAAALEFAEPLYAGQVLSTGEPVWAHALGLAGNLAAIGLDAPARAAGVLFAAPKYLPETEKLQDAFGDEVAALAAGVEKLYQLRLATRGTPSEQNEVLRKMVLGMVEDVRVVLIRLASRTQTLRWFSKNKTARARAATRARRLDIYAPLANRLGVWPAQVGARGPVVPLPRARALQAHRADAGREAPGARAIHRPARSQALSQRARRRSASRPRSAAGRSTSIPSGTRCAPSALDFSEVYDVRALRVIVPEVKDCYTALGVVHNLWHADPQGVRRLHLAAQGQPVPVAAHRGGRAARQDAGSADPHRRRCTATPSTASPRTGATRKRAPRRRRRFEQKIAWLRQLLAWRDEVADWQDTKQAQLDDRSTCSRRRGEVIDLPAGSTPIDFAYALHSDLGHRCRGARVDGHIVHARHAARERPARRDRHRQDRRPVARLAESPSAASSRAPARATRSASGSTPRRSPRPSPPGAPRSRRSCGAKASARQPRRARSEARASSKPDELFAAVARDEVNLRQLQVALQGRRSLP